MAFGSSKFLGLALGDRSILAAQVKVSGDRKEVVAAAELVFPPNLTWDDPAAVGNALRQFLRQHRLSASRAIVGVPARWLMAREREVPPADARTASGILRLQAERDFPAELELVYDYAGHSDTAKARKVLLVAMPKRRMDAIEIMADHARLSVAAVTSSSLALASASSNGTREALSLLLSADAAELVVSGQTAPRMLKHLAISVAANGQSAATVAALGGEVQRAVALLPPEGDSGSPRVAMLWDGVGLDAEAAEGLSRRGGVPVRIAEDLADLGMDLRTPNSNERRFGAAAALAVAGASRRLEIDFLHTRLAVPKVRRISREKVLAVVAVLAVVGGLAWLWIDVLRREGNVQAIREQIKQEQAKEKSGKIIAERVKFAEGWFRNRPPVLGCLKQLTEAFPPDGRIVATSFTYHEDGKVEIGARTPDQNLALSLAESLKAKSFTDVTVPNIGDRVARSGEAPFIVKANYVGQE